MRSLLSAHRGGLATASAPAMDQVWRTSSGQAQDDRSYTRGEKGEQTC